MGFNRDRLRAQLRASKRSYAWLGRRIGVSAASVCYYLSGKRIPGQDKVERMAEHLGCSVEFLMPPADSSPSESFERVS